MPGSDSARCYSAILRRLICQCSLPTHPSDETQSSVVDQKTDKSLPVEEIYVRQAAAVSTPGVVARLMGLESFPSTPNERNTVMASFLRSRSVNSIDFVAHFDPTRNWHHAHRRVRTSVSFRQVVDDNFRGYREDFLIRRRPKMHDQKTDMRKEVEVSRDTRKKVEVGKTGKRSTDTNMSPKSRNGIPEKKKALQIQDQDNTKLSLKKTRPIAKHVNYKNELPRGFNGEKRKTTKPLKKLHPECSAPEVIEGLGSRNPRDIHRPTPNAADFDTGEARAKRKTKRKKKRKESGHYTRLFEEICGLTEEGMESNWSNGMMVFKFEEEMSQQFSQEILEVLLEQFVVQLLPHNWTRNGMPERVCSGYWKKRAETGDEEFVELHPCDGVEHVHDPTTYTSGSGTKSDEEGVSPVFISILNVIF